jgi:C1A family cysteine protease
MKKTIYTVFAIAAIMMATTSCTDQTIDPVTTPTIAVQVKSDQTTAPNSESITGEYGRGLIFAKESDYLAMPVAKSLSNARVAIPAKVDLTDYFPAPRNQGQQASCVGFAISSVKAYQENKQNNVKTFLFSPAFIYNQAKIGTCLQGTPTIDALKLTGIQGVALESDFPYNADNCMTMPSATVKQKAMPYRTGVFHTLALKNNTMATSIGQMKEMLAAGNPILVGTRVDNAFEKHRSGIFTTWNSINMGGHMMAVIGYDDATQSFKMINSWGKNWGEGGYIRINYETLMSKTYEAYVSLDAK